MSGNLINCIKDFEFISKFNKSDRKKLLAIMAKKPKYYLALKEIALNLIKGNIELENKVKRKLLKHRKLIKSFVKSNSQAVRKKVVVQSGGWLWIIPIIQEIISLLK